MTRKGLATIGAALGLTLVIWAGQGRAQQGRAEKAGEKIDEALQSLREGVGKASESVRERFGRVKTGVQNMGIEARIYGRLHWDKALNSSSIDLEVRKEGVAIIRGKVADAAPAKQKAVTLTRETVGVTQVIDELTVAAAPRDRTVTAQHPVAGPPNPVSEDGRPMR